MAKGKITFECVPSKGKWYGRIRHGNNEITFTGETQHNLQDLKDTFTSLKNGAADAEIVVLPKSQDEPVG